jgi:hypothetical protein
VLPARRNEGTITGVLRGGAELHVRFDNGTDGAMTLADVKSLCMLAAAAHEE